METPLQPLSVAGVKEAIAADAVLLDTRPATLFTQGFIPGSISLGLEGKFAEWAAILLPRNKPLVLITEEGKEVESSDKLREKGFTNIAGFLKGGFATWRQSGEVADLVIDVEADELAMDLPFDEKIVVLDVRQPNEYAEGHVADAVNVPLDEFTDLVNIANIEEDQNVYIHCGAGYRSVVAASLLKRQGVHNIRNMLGGWNAIREEGRIKKVKEEQSDKEKEPEE
jgi:hydroxyacylglutathione hydrolase